MVRKGTVARATATTFSISTDSYASGLRPVQLGLHVERTLNGNLSTADSNGVTVRMVAAVDP